MKKGDLAICSMGALGLVTVNEPEVVIYKDGNSAEAWVGIHLTNDIAPAGSLWSSRNPEVVGNIADFLFYHSPSKGAKKNRLTFCGNPRMLSTDRTKVVIDISVARCNSQESDDLFTKFKGRTRSLERLVAGSFYQTIIVDKNTSRRDFYLFCKANEEYVLNNKEVFVERRISIKG